MATLRTRKWRLRPKATESDVSTFKQRNQIPLLAYYSYYNKAGVRFD